MNLPIEKRMFEESNKYIKNFKRRRRRTVGVNMHGLAGKIMRVKARKRKRILINCSQYVFWRDALLVVIISINLTEQTCRLSWHCTCTFRTYRWIECRIIPTHGWFLKEICCDLWHEIRWKHHTIVVRLLNLIFRWT